jgi:hypothetical protein
MPVKGFRLTHCKRGHLISEVGRTGSGYCKLCSSIRAKNLHKKHPERRARYTKNWIAKQPKGFQAARARRYRKEHPEAVQSTRLKGRYGITKADQDAQLKTQRYRCAVCRTKFTKDCKPETDHDHTTQQVRGQVCHACNMLLGAAKECLRTLSNAIQYLKKWEAQHDRS